jgi:hypothetical protein
VKRAPALRGAFPRAWALAIACSPVATLAQAQAYSEGPQHVTLLQDGCAAVSYDLREFATLLQVELRALGVERLDEVQNTAQLEPDAEGAAFVRVRCRPGEAQLRIEVSDLLSGKQIARELSVSDTEQKARPRALALVVALLLQNSWVELAMRDPNSAEGLALPGNVRVRLRRRLRSWLEEPAAAPPPSAATALRDVPADHRPDTLLSVFAIARAFPGSNTGLIGADLMFARALGPLRLALNVETLFGSQDLEDANGAIADVSLFWVTGGLAVLWTSATRPELSVGPFASFGYGVASGRARRTGYSSYSDGGFVSAIGATALLRAAVTSRVDLWAGMDFGYLPSGVLFLADQARLAGMAEVTVSVRAGLGLGF